MLKDSYNRPLLNLRIAITQRCNLNCIYCHKEGEENSNVINEMKIEEITRITKIATNLGITKVKITGGEPLLRGDIVEIIKNIGLNPRVKDLSMTTNGIYLSKFAKDLYLNGLKRVNIQLPTINKKKYHNLTGGNVDNVLRGINAAIKCGLYPVKLNMLVLRGENDNNIQEMIDFSKENGVILQLIELEPINVTNQYFSHYYKSLDVYEKSLKKKSVKIETRSTMQNRRIYHLPDVKVEIIRPKDNEDFCMHCTKIRITSDGKLKPCLMENVNLVDILTPIRKGVNDKEIAKLFQLANQRRCPYNLNK